MSFDGLLIAAADGALVLCAAWALLICAAAVLEVVSSGRLCLTARLGCPAPLRRALLTALGLVLAGGSGLHAGAASAAPGPLGTASRGQLGLPVPVRPLGAAPVLPRQRVEVRPGDSLWRLSERRAPARATTQDLARLVDRTYRANREVIGPDPDLIRPGQQLRVPRQLRRTENP